VASTGSEAPLHADVTDSAGHMDTTATFIHGRGVALSSASSRHADTGLPHGMTVTPQRHGNRDLFHDQVGERW